MQDKLLALDFFCGAGGLTRGLLNAGIHVAAGFDSDGECKRSYQYNNPQSKFVNEDIRKLSTSDLRKHTRGLSFDDMLFAGCAPCQPFSNHVNEVTNWRDATLLSEFARIIASAHPRYVLMENVPGMVKVKGNSTFRRFLSTLKSNGYGYVYRTFDAKELGVPQTRRRLLLLAVRKQQPTLPISKHGKKGLPFRTVRQAISHFPPISAGQSDPKIPNHVAASITPLNLERLRCTPDDGGDRRSWPDHLWLQCHEGDYEGHSDVYGRMAWDFPSPTLTGRCHSISNGRYGHPTQDRAISLREAAALQSFPDGYLFFGSNKHIAQQIGNAVPVLLAEELGRHLLHLRENLS